MTLEADDDGTGLKTSLRFFERIFLPQANLLTHSLTRTDKTVAQAESHKKSKNSTFLDTRQERNII